MTADRLERQKNLDKFIKDKTQQLLKKSNISGYSGAASTIGKSLIDIEEYMSELKDIKNESSIFFKNLESEEI